jgi:hypothetical protein
MPDALAPSTSWPLRPWPSAGPRIEREQRQHAEHDAAEIGETPSCVDREHERDDRERELDVDREPRDDAGREREPRAVAQQQRERSEPEQRRQFVIEEHVRKDADQAAGAERHCCDRPVAGHESLGRGAHQEQQEEEREGGAPERNLPGRRVRHRLRFRERPGHAVGRTVHDEARRLEYEVVRHRPEREPRRFRRIEVTVHICVVAGPALVGIDARRPVVGDRGHEREVRVLIRARVLQDGRPGERQRYQRNDPEARPHGAGHPHGHHCGPQKIPPGAVALSSTSPTGPFALARA